MRVLLVNTNREKLPQPVVPLGLCCVASALAERGDEVRVVDLCFVRQPEAAIQRALTAFQPDLVGLSIRNIDNSDASGTNFYLPGVKRLVDAARRASSAPIVLGGAAVGVTPWGLLEYLDCDLACAGDGEAAIVALVEAIERGDASAAEGAERRADGKIVVHGRFTTETQRHRGDSLVDVGRREAAERTLTTETQRHREDFFNSSPRQCASGVSPSLRFPSPAIHRWLDLGPYRRYGLPMPVQTKRGCALACAYCTYRALEGPTYRRRLPDEVADEVAEVVGATGYRFFELVDSVFNVPSDHAVAVCDELARRGLKPRVQASISPAGLTREVLTAMRRAGFESLVCSPDSASDVVLERLGKGFRQEDLARAVALTHEANIPVIWSFLFGGPGETEATARETLRFIEERLPPGDVVFLSAGVRVYPGAPLVEVARREGVIGAAEALVEPVFYFSPEIEQWRLDALLAEHQARRRNYLRSADLRLPFLPALQRTATRLGIRGPLWRYSGIFNRLAPGRGRMSSTRRFSAGEDG